MFWSPQRIGSLPCNLRNSAKKARKPKFTEEVGDLDLESRSAAGVRRAAKKAKAKKDRKPKFTEEVDDISFGETSTKP